MALLQTVLFALLVVLNSLDGFSTWKVLRPAHFHRERNRIARRLFLKLGIPRGIIVAEALWIGCLTAIFLLLRRDPVLDPLLTGLLAIGVTIFSWVVISNFREVRKMNSHARAAKQAGKGTQSC